MKSIRLYCLVPVLAGLLSAVSLQAQNVTASPASVETSRLTDVGPNDDAQSQIAQNQSPPQSRDPKSSPPDAPTPVVVGAASTNPDGQFGKQPKRILGIIPNYRAVSANAHLPPLDFKGELWLATQDTFDYSSFIFVGALAGVDMAQKSQPTFGQGAEGFGKYYWHVFVDSGIENYMTEAIVPAATKEDPRYYTLAKNADS